METINLYRSAQVAAGSFFHEIPSMCINQANNNPYIFIQGSGVGFTHKETEIFSYFIGLEKSKLILIGPICLFPRLFL